MFLIFLNFFLFHLDLLQSIRSNETLLPPVPVRGGTHLLTHIHTQTECFMHVFKSDNQDFSFINYLVN